MAASVSGSKTVSNAVAPHLTGSVLSTLFGIAVENLTLAQFQQIADALDRVSGGHASTATVGSLFS